MSFNLGSLLDGKTDFRRWLKRISYGGGAVLGLQAASAVGCNRWNDHRVFMRLAGKTCSDVALITQGTPAKHFVERPALMDRVVRLLEPGEDLPSDAYYAIQGAPNSGKTHSIRLACEKVGAGVVYVQVNVPDMFGQELATAIDFQGAALNIMGHIQNNLLKTVFKGFGGEEEEGDGRDSIDQAVAALMQGARRYQRRHRRPVVLVLDDVDKLAEKQPGLLEELQGYAKSWSNSGLLRVVFVLSDGPALSQMKRRSSWSRANVSGFVTVEDVSSEEAHRYLAGRGLSPEDAEAVWQVAGGRIGVLSHLATSIADMKIPAAEALHSVIDAAADEFKVAGLLDQGDRRDGGLAAVEALVAAGAGEDDWRSISIESWSRLVPQPAQQRVLLSSRVFTRHYPRQAVMFGSRPTALYAQQLVDRMHVRRHSPQHAPHCHAAAHSSPASSSKAADNATPSADKPKIHAAVLQHGSRAYHSGPKDAGAHASSSTADGSGSDVGLDKCQHSSHCSHCARMERVRSAAAAADAQSLAESGPLDGSRRVLQFVRHLGCSTGDCLPSAAPTAAQGGSASAPSQGPSSATGAGSPSPSDATVVGAAACMLAIAARDDVDLVPPYPDEKVGSDGGATVPGGELGAESPTSDRGTNRHRVRSRRSDSSANQ